MCDGQMMCLIDNKTLLSNHILQPYSKQEMTQQCIVPCLH